jgi:glycosyltransferase involved in cell wall biosynthesis
MIIDPVVSIVMPTFNRTEFLPASVESVFAQTIPQWELIIADDGSNPETLEYLDTLTSDARVRVLRLRRRGNPGAARNAGIAAARAALLAFLDSDDLWAPNKLERQLSVLRANPECRWSYTAFIMVDAQGTPLASERARPWTPYSGDIFAHTVRTTASIRLPSVLANTAFVRETGAFDEAIDRSEDYDLWMRLALRSPVCVVDEPLLRVRRHSSNENGRPDGAYVARDYSLRKLARALDGATRTLVLEERSRNALALAAATHASGVRWRSVAVLAKSLPFSWQYPRWWCGAARALGRACFRRARPRVGLLG